MGRRYALLGAVVLALATVFGALAEPTVLEPFTQSELDTNYEADRTFPSDGVTSVTAFGRENVLRIGIDSSDPQSGQFYRTEGIKSVGAQNFGDGAQIDLYLDPDWEDTAVRAGFWVVGDNGEGGRDNWFGIIEFTNNGEYEGWRVWDSSIGWINSVAVPFSYGQWYTLTIELDTAQQLYNYSIDGEPIGTASAGENYIREVFINSYNFGNEDDDQDGLNEDSYASHWHAGLPILVEAPLHPVCIQPYSGKVTSAVSGACPPSYTEIETPSTEPLTFCIHPYTGEIRFFNSGACPGFYRTHMVPDDGDLAMCTNVYSGKTRYVRGTQYCSRIEIPNVIPAGQR